MADTSKPVIPVSLDDFLQDSSAGPIETAIGNNIYGINHRQTPSPIPISKDHYGLTFFVRPQLNLQSDNIRNLRIFTPLLTKDSKSIQRITRCTLDPRLMIGYPVKSNNLNEPDDQLELDCPLVDNRQAFIPILTNHLKSISGWPDIVSPYTTSKEGSYKEGHSMVDGTVTNYTAYDIEATFRNARGDPILNLFQNWVNYNSAVFEGTLSPYPDFIFENEIDYMTRIYRIVLNTDKTKVQKIAATGVSFPTSVPMGNAFDYSSEKPYNDNNADISIRFHSLGAIFGDDILIKEFNATVAIFNPSMSEDRFYWFAAGNTEMNTEMVKITREYLTIFNNRGYARINPNTYDFNWYVSKEEYNKKIDAIARFRLNVL